MHVGMEEAIAERMAEERLDQAAGERRQVVAGCAERGEIGKLDAVDPFEREHVARRQLPLDLRHAEPLVRRRRLRHLRQGRRFQTEVHLDGDAAGKRVDHRDRPQAPRGRVEALDQARAFVEGREIAPEAAADAGPEHLHSYRPRHVVRSGNFGLVHLCDRGRGNRR